MKIFEELEFQPSQPKTPEKKGGVLKTLKDTNGSFGVYEDYPNTDEVLAGIAENQKQFIKETDNGSNSRVKFLLTLNLKGGQAVNLMVKAKLLNEAADDFYPHTPRLDGSSRQGSVLNELTANREASNRYKKEYGEELPIEKPVGFYISSQDGYKGMRWVIFEELAPIIKDYEIPDSRERKLKYAGEVKKKLAKIGIIVDHYVDPYSLEKDIVFVGDKNNPESIRLVIVDSEDWEIKSLN